LVRHPVRALAAVSRFPHLTGAALIAALASALYLPFLANPPVFDDFYFLWGSNFAYYATHPFGLELRVPPYFSMAVVQLAWWGSIEAHASSLCAVRARGKLVFDASDRACAIAPATGVKARASAGAAVRHRSRGGHGADTSSARRSPASYSPV
jgi:hypothetical protein